VHGDSRAVTSSQTVEIIARHKLQLVINNADLTMSGLNVTASIVNCRKKT
jgi:hypothetical protein